MKYSNTHAEKFCKMMKKKEVAYFVFQHLQSMRDDYIKAETDKNLETLCDSIEESINEIEASCEVEI